MDIDRDYRKLRILLEATDSFVLTFALYRDAKEQRENAKKLREMLKLPVTQVALKGDNLNPVRTFLDLPKEPRQAIFFTFLGSSLPEGKSDFDKFAGYANIQREAFTDAPHAVVLWLREEQLVRLMRRAPDFWAWRSGVFDFRGELAEASGAYSVFKLTDTYERTSLEEEVALYRKILKSQLQRDKPDLAYVVRTRLRLANTLYKLGFYKEMASEAHEALSVARTLKDEALEVDALGNLAHASYESANYDEAILLYREAVKLGEKVFGREDKRYAALLNVLAGSLESAGRYNEAEPLYKESIELVKKTLGEEQTEYAFILNNFAGFLESTGRFDEAEPLYRKVINILAETLSKKHPRYAASINNLAVLFTKTRQYDEAEALYREAVEIVREAVGKEHPNHALGLRNLANLLMEVGRYDEAEPLLREALEVCREFLGEAHPFTKEVEADYQFLKQGHFYAEQAISKTA